MSDIRQLDTFLYYYNEAHNISPSPLEEKLGVLYLDYSVPNSLANHAEDKTIFETSFTSYSGIKVYI